MAAYSSTTISGAPKSGSFVKGDTFTDSGSTVWECVKSGYPGDWTAIPQGLTAAELDKLDGLGATQAELDQAADVSAMFEDVITTNVIAATENGKTFFLNLAAGFVSTLPAPALGLRFTFIVKTAPSGGSYTVVTTSSANVIKGLQNSVAGDAGDSGTADDTISFVDGQALPGDKVEVVSDGTSWFAYAISKVAAGITFTQASA